MPRALIRFERRRAAAAVAVLAAALGLPAIAAATRAPSAATRVASARATAVFHTKQVNADFSLLSGRDPHWALVDGFATRRSRPWAAWLHRSARGAWDLRYFVSSAPFEPQTATRGRVPCDLVPAFSEPRCRPAQDVAQLRRLLAGQLLPAGSGARIGAILRNGGYTQRFTLPMTGGLRLDWYASSAGTGAARTLVARGATELLPRTSGTVNVKLTAAGIRMLKRATGSLRLTAEIVFTPILYADVRATRGFLLRR